MIDAWTILKELALAVIAAIGCIALIIALQPLLVRYVLARPNARSSHRRPTPQGGGIAVIGTTVVVVVSAMVFAPGLLSHPRELAGVLAATIALAVLGAAVDIRPMRALPRLFLQTAAATIVVAVLPAELRIVSVLPGWLERLCILLGVLWFVNLVNFMDGIDWMTVAEVVPITASLTLFGLMGALPQDAAVVAVVLCGAIVGFAPFNRPVARLFLGDVGSLPIGLLLGWLLVMLAGSGHLAAAVLLPLYYLTDASFTLLRRFVKGEPLMQAHRQHFYQRAMDRGVSVYRIVGSVFLLNVALAALATATVLVPSRLLHVACVAVGGVMVCLLLYRFERGNRVGNN
jgi:UDP-N-acetylmuramyl pentapeptide phosphotransferase/UDP-N-acetylglucosamine-1-phosphate transferase